MLGKSDHVVIPGEAQRRPGIQGKAFNAEPPFDALGLLLSTGSRQAGQEGDGKLYSYETKQGNGKSEKRGEERY